MNYDSLVVYQCVQFATDRHFCPPSALFVAAAGSGFELETLAKNESVSASMGVAGDRARELILHLCGSPFGGRFIQRTPFSFRQMTIRYADFAICTRCV
jgi:hypothetical protein